MATFNPRIFTNPGRLKTIAPHRLVAFFAPWKAYLTARGVDLPDDPTADIPYDALSGVLMSPDENVPRGMVDALYYVHETASEEDMDALLAMVQHAGVAIEHDPETSVADVAVQVWLARPSLLESRHAEAVAFKQKNFMYFAGSVGAPRDFPDLTEERRRAIQERLDEWYLAHRRGGDSRVFAFPRGPRVWLLVRHGMPMRREGSHGKDGRAATEYYRPQQHDVMIYDSDLDEMAVHATTKGEREILLTTFGSVLFGHDDYFPPAAKFTLDPLLQVGADSLSCDDIDGITSARLVEYQKYWGGAHKEIEVRKATNIFAALGDQWQGRLAGGRLSSAVFKIAFEGSAKERSVTIRPPNIAKYERDDDSELVETWLRERRFCKHPDAEPDDDAPADAALEDA